MSDSPGTARDMFRHRIALDAIDVAVFEYYADDDRFEANPNWYRLTGLAPGNGLDALLSHFPEGDATEVGDLLNTGDSGGRARFTYPFKDSPTGCAWVSISGFFKARGESPGVAPHFAGTLIDVSEWKAIELNYEQTESVLKMAFENMPVGLLYVNAETRTVELANSFAKELFGLSAEEMIGKPCQVFMCAAQKGVCPVCDLGESINNSEVKIVRPDGSAKWALKSVIKITARETLRLLECFSDITSQKKTEEALRSVTDHLTLAARAGGVGIWRLDTETGVEEWDDQMYRLYAATREEFPTGDRAWKARIHPEDRDYQNARIKLAADGNEDFDTEFRIVWPDGSAHIIRAMAMLQSDESGEPRYLIGTNWDITRQKETENELIKSNLHLEAAGIRANQLALEAETANNAKSAFLATMSHEIRTPMNGVIGMTDLLLDSPLSDEQHRYAELLKTSGETLMSLINDMLDFSKIEANRLELESADFNLREMIRTTVSMMDVNAREKALSLNAPIASDVPPFVRGDAKRLRQILVNLIGNAIKFTDRGNITVDTRLAGEDSSSVRIRIEIIDTGIGIPPGKQKSLFVPFSQLDNSSTRKYGGTGLGLAISRQLAELMGGTISVSSDGSHGTTFAVTLRFAKSESPAHSAESDRATFSRATSCRTAQGGATQNRETGATDAATPERERLAVLLAEDNPTNQIIARKMLEKIGHEVDIVANGEEALDAVALKEYDLVFMDCQMPWMDGYEATRRIRSRGLTVPIIAMTAHALAGDREKCLDAGMNDYVTKPVRMETLAAAIADRAKYAAESASRVSSEARAAKDARARAEPELFLRETFMGRVMNDTSLARTVIESFLSDIPLQIDSLRACVASGDFAGAEHYAHRVNGASANLGCDRLRKYACEAERAALAKDGDRLRSFADKVSQIWSDTKPELEAFR
jgi:PAS domain S-box-containing protein